ncbi:MAG: CsbD family protein [Candidatus Gottesmanbacteria bacterium]|nr:CsbD family protein [Candidatus Gottesmanbacteria bacterium]
MNKDQVNGRIKEVIGKVKEVAGKITDDKDLEVKGNIQKNIGKAQADFGDLKNNLKKWLLLKRI